MSIIADDDGDEKIAEPIAREGGVVLRKGGLDDWYLIELVKHENQTGLRRGPYGLFLYVSSRPSDADVEGSAAEMRVLATAIEARGQESFTRCAVDARTDRVLLWSPRNSQRPGAIPRADADALAAQIRRELPQ